MRDTAILRDTALAAIVRRSNHIRQRPSLRALRRWLREAPTQIVALLREWRERRRSRAELASLDERMLRDIGVSRADVWHEINKPFWRK